MSQGPLSDRRRNSERRRCAPAHDPVSTFELDGLNLHPRLESGAIAPSRPSPESPGTVDTPDDHRIEFHIGVELGGAIVQDDDVSGDGAKVVARLEGLIETMEERLSWHGR